MANDIASWLAEVTVTGDRRAFLIVGPGAAHGDPVSFRTTIEAGGQQEYLDLFARLAATFGTRRPSNRSSHALPSGAHWHEPLLTRNISHRICYGYGDPCVLRVDEESAWYLVVTSNDAPDAFPILRSSDLHSWELASFGFPTGNKPAWAAQGPDVSDFWAPELHRIGNEYLLCFTARAQDGSLAVGLAKSALPTGPFATSAEPLLTGGVIDAHLHVDPAEGAMLLWKDDSNGTWPRLMAAMIEKEPRLATHLFSSEEDQRTARLSGALWSWGRTCGAMEQFFLLQPLIEAVTDRFDETRRRLAALETLEGRSVLEAMRTPIRAQRLGADHASLVGEPVVLITNDLPWEGHLIEGPWLTRHAGRFYLFYSGNDFTNHNYGIGVAVSESRWGPFAKAAQPLIRSDSDWIAPGHPSIAKGLTGNPQLFYHAYPPGEAGYKAFRALLTCGLRFGENGVTPVPVS
jgi:hypothetical protein